MLTSGDCAYSYQLELTKSGPEGILFEDTKRATSKKNADGIDFSGLFKTVKRQQSQTEQRAIETKRDAAFELIREYVENPPEDEAAVGEISLAARLGDMDPVDQFTVDQWLKLVDVSDA